MPLTKTEADELTSLTRQDRSAAMDAAVAYTQATHADYYGIPTASPEDDPKLIKAQKARTAARMAVLIWIADHTVQTIPEPPVDPATLNDTECCQ